MAAKKKKKKKLTGKKKEEFLLRMKKGRAAAAKRKGGKKKGGKKKTTKKKATKHTTLTAAQRKAMCGPREGAKRKSASKKKKGAKGKSTAKRRCVPCSSDRNLPVIRKRLGKQSVKNVTCAIVRVGNSCRKICFTTVGKSHLKSGAINPKAKRFLLSNQPAKGCTKGRRTVPAVVLRGIVGL